MRIKYVYACAALLLSSACGESGETTMAEAFQPDNSAEVKAYYDSTPISFDLKPSPTFP